MHVLVFHNYNNNTNCRKDPKPSQSTVVCDTRWKICLLTHCITHTHTHTPHSVYIQTDTGVSVEMKCRIDTDVELSYYQHGGILNYMVRKMCQ